MATKTQKAQKRTGKKKGGRQGMVTTENTEETEGDREGWPQKHRRHKRERGRKKAEDRGRKGREDN